jgi:hypothetical protein
MNKIIDKMMSFEDKKNNYKVKVDFIKNYSSNAGDLYLMDVCKLDDDSFVLKLAYSDDGDGGQILQYIKTELGMTVSNNICWKIKKITNKDDYDTRIFYRDDSFELFFSNDTNCDHASNHFYKKIIDNYKKILKIQSKDYDIR